MLRLLSPATLLAVLVLAAVPIAAQATTKTTAAGPALKKAPPGTPPYADVPQFFPTRTVVRMGDSVRWKFYGFHSIYFPKRGGKNASLVAVDASRQYAELDPAGAGFWFNGMKQFVADPAAVFPVGGKTVNGTRVTGSGLPQSPKFTYKLSFPKAGTYTYYCTIHPSMKGTVQVLPRRRAVRSATQEKQIVRKQLAAAVSEVKRQDRKADATGNVVEAGRDTHKTSLLTFFPAEKTVPVGTTVEFRMPEKTNEIHTVSFGSAAVLAKGGYAEQQSENLLAPLPGTGKNGPPVLGMPGSVFFPTDPGPLSFDGTQHGGFLSTGLMGERPLPHSQKVTFTKAGTYRYICLVHPFMKGAIVVK